jgi:O-antigen biosynthesis protein WbqP
MSRLFEIIFILIIISIIFLPYLLICIIIIIQSDGKILHWSKRVGRNNEIFLMPKFRTMKKNTPQLATHLLKDAKSYLTLSGSFLRKTSLDELPQIYSVLMGNMTFVGPRPALFNQYDLINERSLKGIQTLKPGITGLAQINGRDALSINEKVKFDYLYLLNKSIFFDIKIILLTLKKVFVNKNVSH